MYIIVANRKAIVAQIIKSVLGTSIGSYGTIVEVECHMSNSLPNIVIVGFATKAVDEAKERVRGALASSEIKIPKKRITINMAPADIPKEGSSFDLAIVLAILQTAKIVNFKFDDYIVLGELGLDGSIRPIRGIIGKILAAKKLGMKKFIIPESNLKQARLIPNIEILAAKNLKGLVMDINSDQLILEKINAESTITQKSGVEYNEVSFEDIVGQDRAKRALLIAAAGHHNIILNGPPGTGKSMLAKAMVGIMPQMNTKEMLEVTHIHSLANKDFDQIITKRPLRSPHHSSSQVSIVGGGQHLRPGEISMSHHGILFFDEIPEFNRSILEALRQPLEDRKITIARAKDSQEFPAHFMLIGTSNPCPCGFYNTDKDCICMPHQIANYQKKMSGPVMDRMDLYVEVDNVNHEMLLSKQANQETSQTLQDQVIEARKKQISRQNKLNSELSGKEIKTKLRLSSEAEKLLNDAANKLNLSARAYMRSIRVANTIADLNKSTEIGVAEISEALQYRKKPIEFI